MVSLTRLHESISKLTKLDDQTEIQAGIEDIFFQLIYEKQTFYTVCTDNVPVVASIPNDPQHRYLRLFSDNEIVQKYIDKNPDVSICEVTAVESAQMAKSAFVKGIYGYILNEGDKWITITLAEYLSIFATRILKEPDMFNQLCADLVTFIGEVRYGNPCRYKAAYLDDGTIVVGDDTVVIQSEDNPAPEEVPDTQLKEITIQILFSLNAKNVLIRTPRGELSVSGSLLHTALKYCGLTEDSPSSEDFSTLTDWKLKDVSDFAVTFEPTADDKPQNPAQTEEDAEPTEPQQAGDNSETTEPKPNLLSMLQRILTAAKENLSLVTQKAKGILSKRFQKGEPQKYVSEAREDPLENSTEESQEPEHPEEELPPEDDSGQEETEQKPPFWDTKRKRIALCIACAAVLLAVVGGVFIVKQIQYKERFTQFCAYVSDWDYGNAYVLYRDNNFSTDADAYLCDEIDLSRMPS